jgi:DNA-binding transcriptional MerR regulator
MVCRAIRPVAASIGASNVNGKSEGAFRTIGEVAESLDLPPHVLRFWETRFTEIEPVKRAGGRRYYRPRDVELVAAIRHLLYGRGYTIKGVQRLLREQGVRAVIDNARGAAREPLGFDVDAPPRREEDAQPIMSKQDEEPAAAVRRDLEEAVSEAAPQRLPASAPGTTLVPLARPIIDLPAVRVVETAAPGLTPQDVRRLKAALDDLAECRRMLELTRR